MPKLSKYFTWKEAACRDGTAVPKDFRLAVELHAMEMDEIRLFFGAPVRINSWYRTPEYNNKVQGGSKSKHLLGIACDFTVDGVESTEVRRALEGLIRIGMLREGGIGAYKLFTHYDSRGTKARWNG